jgi:competence protein ComEC
MARSALRQPLPAVAPSCALLLGVLLGEAGVPDAVAAGVSTAAAVAAAVALLAPTRAIRACAALSLLCFGAGWYRAGAERRRQAELDASLPPGHSVPSDVLGSVDAAALPTEDGGRRLVVRGRIEALAEADPRVWRVRVDVAPSPEDPLRAVDGIRAGDTVRFWGTLRRPSPPGNPGEPDPLRSLRGRGLDAVAYVKSARLVAVVRRPARPWLSWSALRRASRARAERIAGDDPAVRGLVLAMLLGDRGALDDATTERLRAAGLAHLLAISGLHVAVLAAALVALVRRCGAPGRMPWAALLVLTAFPALVGASPPVLRAVASSLAALVGRRLGREGNGLNTLALCAAGLALWRPVWVWLPSFQLSVLATAGILVGARPLAVLLPLPGILARPLALSLAAYLATAPVAALAFGYVAPAGILFNLVAVPLCAAITGSGYLTLLGVDSLLPGEPCAALCRQAARALLAVGGVTDLLRLGAHATPPPPGWSWLPYYLAALGSLPSQRPRVGRRIAAAGFVALCLSLHVGTPPPAPRNARVHVLDVGQGQAVLIEAPGGETMLVDAGGATGPSAARGYDPGARIVLPALRRAGVRRLAVLALTHGDADHAAGADVLLRRIEVGELWLGVGWAADPRLAELAVRAVRRGVAVRGVSRGQRVAVGRLELEVLSPARSFVRAEANDRSIVLRLVVRGAGGARLLLPGDVESRGEAELLLRPSRLRAEALLLAHHGGRTSNGAALLDAVRPRWALVSCGRENRFGHPHREVLDRLRARRIPLRRTDREGRLTLEATATGWRVRGWRDAPHARGSEQERHGDERHQQHRRERDRERDAPRTDGEPLVEQPRVSVAHPEQDREPQHVCRKLPHRDDLVDDQPADGEDRRPRHPAVQPARDGVDRVAAVELTHREQVERRHEHAHPARADEVVDAHGSLANPRSQHLQDQRCAEAPALSLETERRRGLGDGEADEQRGERDDEARDGTRRGDVEQRATVGDRRADADHRTERPDGWDAR